MDKQTPNSEEEHRMLCPDCGESFDMRDLSAVFDHQHWMKKKPEASFSHVIKQGTVNEVYVKVRKRMLTLRFMKNSL